MFGPKFVCSMLKPTKLTQRCMLLFVGDSAGAQEGLNLGLVRNALLGTKTGARKRTGGTGLQ